MAPDRSARDSKKSIPDVLTTSELINGLNGLHDDVEVAIVGHTIVERALRRRWRRELRKDLTRDQWDKIFGGRGVLDGFSNPAHLAFGLKLIDENVYADLRVIADIRNSMVHRFDTGVDFAHSQIREKIDNLKINHENYKEIIELHLGVDQKIEQNVNGFDVVITHGPYVIMTLQLFDGSDDPILIRPESTFRSKFLLCVGTVSAVLLASKLDLTDDFEEIGNRQDVVAQP